MTAVAIQMHCSLTLFWYYLSFSNMRNRLRSHVLREWELWDMLNCCPEFQKDETVKTQPNWGCNVEHDADGTQWRYAVWTAVRDIAAGERVSRPS